MPSAALQLTPTVFRKSNVLSWVQIAGKFYWFWICSSLVLNFQIFFEPAETAISRCFWVGFWLEFQKMGYSRKTPNRVSRTWNFQGYWKKNMWKFHGSIKKRSGISRSVQEYSINLGFDLEISNGCHTTLQNFLAWKLVSLEFHRVKWQIQKIPGAFSEKYILNTPFLLFGFFLE